MCVWIVSKKFTPKTSKNILVWKDFGQSGKFPDNLKSLQTVCKVSGQSEKVSGQYEKFPDSRFFLDSFQTVLTIYAFFISCENY